MNSQQIISTPLLRALLLTIVLSIISGCSQQMAKERQANHEKMVAAIEEGIDTTASRPPAEIEAELLAIGIGEEIQHQPVDLERQFDIKARRLRARDFFLSLVEGTPYNMVIHPEVGGYISLEM
ncbi:MAG: hypothetical protein GQ470_05990 [Gammaproteobacteria bacterium]|nr:hypothetical protein [Gammaproteobacteria bacterium]